MLAHVLNITIVLVSPDEVTVISEGTENVIYLAYFVDFHFDSLLGEATGSIKNDVNRHVSPTGTLAETHISINEAWSKVHEKKNKPERTNKHNNRNKMKKKKKL